MNFLENRVHFDHLHKNKQMSKKRAKKRFSLIFNTIVEKKHLTNFYIYNNLLQNLGIYYCFNKFLIENFLFAFLLIHYINKLNNLYL